MPHTQVVHKYLTFKYIFHLYTNQRLGKLISNVVPFHGRHVILVTYQGILQARSVVGRPAFRCHRRHVSVARVGRPERDSVWNSCPRWMGTTGTVSDVVAIDLLTTSSLTSDVMLRDSGFKPSCGLKPAIFTPAWHGETSSKRSKVINKYFTLHFRRLLMTWDWISGLRRGHGKQFAHAIRYFLQQACNTGDTWLVAFHKPLPWFKSRHAYESCKWKKDPVHIRK